MAASPTAVCATTGTVHPRRTEWREYDRPNAVALRWSADGHHLLYIRDDALWLIDTHGDAPSRIVGPFPGTPDLFGYYGHVSWPIVAAWYRR
jgi:hypothetical protein